MAANEVREGLTLPGGWTVRAVSARRLELRKDSSLLSREVLRRAGIVLVPLVLAAALGGGTWNEDLTVTLIAWPVLALLIVVVLLSVLSVVRAWRRFQLGVLLEIDTQARTATGWVQGQGLFSDSLAPPRAVPFSELRGVELASFTGDKPGAPGFVSLSLTLAQGRLEGPEGHAAPTQLTEVLPALEEAAAALAQRTGAKLTRR